MLKNMDLYVTPVLNVDGYMYSRINESVSYLKDIMHLHHYSALTLPWCMGFSLGGRVLM